MGLGARGAANAAPRFHVCVVTGTRRRRRIIGGSRTCSTATVETAVVRVDVGRPTSATRRPAGGESTNVAEKWAALGLATFAGVAMLLAFPPYGLWWAAPIGVAAFALAVHGRPLRVGAGRRPGR